MGNPDTGKNVSPLHGNIDKIVKEIASVCAIRHGQQVVNSALVFDALFRFISVQSDFIELKASVSKIFDKYGITVDMFDKAYCDVFPTRDALPEGTKTKFDKEISDIYNILNIKAKTEKRQQNVEDLANVLFGNDNYKLFLVFTRLSERMKEEYEEHIAVNGDDENTPPTSFDVYLLYSDFRDLFLNLNVKEIKSLETKDMQKYLVNINKRVALNKYHKVIGMQKTLDALCVALARRTKKSAILVGPPGCGKSVIVDELANRINNGNVPEFLKDMLIYELRMDAVAAGASFVGQFEQRLLTILDAVAKVENVILFIDEAHLLVNAGGHTSNDGGSMTGGNLIKKYLSSGQIKCIAATTDAEYSEYFEKDKAITRRFTRVNVKEPSKEETLEILRGLVPINNEFFDKELNEELLEKIYDTSGQFNLKTSNPDRSITLLESGYAYARTFKDKNPDKSVTLEDIMRELELEYNIVISNNKADDTRKSAKELLFSQDNVIDKVCDFLKIRDLKIVSQDKPVSMFFAGATGTGKTELSKILAKYYTGSETNLIKINCNEYTHETDASTLFGTSAGYIGFERTSPFLRDVQNKPNSIILFDEFEKMHPAIVKTLLNILDEGYCDDKGGNRISFKNAIIIFTSNIGYGTSNYNGSGIMSKGVNDEETSRTAINKQFSPEFLNRLNTLVFFNRLDNSAAKKIIAKELDDICKRSGINIEFNTKDYNAIIEEANVAQNGARDIKSQTEQHFFKKYTKGNK